MANIIEINDLSAPELQVYAGLTRRQAALQNLFVAESDKAILSAMDAGIRPVSVLCERKFISTRAAEVIARAGDIPVYTADSDVLCSLTGYELSRGVLCAMERPREKSFEEAIENARRIAVLEDLNDPTNAGAIFRSAAALGADAVLLKDSCIDCYSRRCVRVSMGNVFRLPIACIGDEELQKLKDMGYTTVALALTDRSVSVNDPAILGAEKVALVLGSEGNGLKQSTIDLCAYTAKIPMTKNVESLNVAAAAAVAFWTIFSARD